MIFLLIVGGVLAGNVAFWIWADRRLRGLAHSRRWRIALAVLIGANLLFAFAPRIAGHAGLGVYAVTPARLSGWFYLWNLVFLPLWLVAVLAKGGFRAAGRLLRGKRPEVPVAERRLFLGGAAAFAPPLLAGGSALISVPRLAHFRVRDLDVAVPGLPKELDGMTIAHVSDVHVGTFCLPGVLDRARKAINDMHADVIAMTGDLINLSLDELPEGLDFIRKLDCRHGIYLCEGNHDAIDNRAEFAKRVRGAGIPLLLDEACDLKVRGRPVQVLATRWGRSEAERARDVRALEGKRDPEAFPILLAHHPHTFDPAAAAGYPLVLSGHTHGGMIMWSDEIGFGSWIYRYWSGLYRKPASRLVVSNGLGHWFPLRINAPAELVRLTLRLSPRA